MLGRLHLRRCREVHAKRGAAVARCGGLKKTLHKHDQYRSVDAAFLGCPNRIWPARRSPAKQTLIIEIAALCCVLIDQLVPSDRDALSPHGRASSQNADGLHSCGRRQTHWQSRAITPRYFTYFTAPERPLVATVIAFCCSAAPQRPCGRIPRFPISHPSSGTSSLSSFAWIFRRSMRTVSGSELLDGKGKIFCSFRPKCAHTFVSRKDPISGFSNLLSSGAKASP
jgi:hypothetical protein